MRPLITSSDLKAELREILFRWAARIAPWAGPEAANAFIKIDIFNDDLDTPPPCDEAPASILERIDLDRFPAAEALMDAYRMKFEAWSDPILPDAEIWRDMLGGFPKTDAKESVPACLGPDGICRKLLEWGVLMGEINTFLTGGVGASLFLPTPPTLTVRQLSILADTSEGTVRNAISRGALRTRTSRGVVVADIDAAFRWLASRRGFEPRRVGMEIDPLTFARYSDEKTAAIWFASVILWLVGSPGKIAAKLGWSVEEVEEMLGGNFPDDDRVRSVASIMGVSPDDLVLAVRSRRASETSRAK